MALDGTLVVMLGLGFGTSHVACVERTQCHHGCSGSAAVRAGWRSCGHSRRTLVRDSWQAALEQRLQALPGLWALTARSADSWAGAWKCPHPSGTGLVGVGCSHWFCFASEAGVPSESWKKLRSRLIVHQRCYWCGGAVEESMLLPGNAGSC